MFVGLFAGSAIVGALAIGGACQTAPPAAPPPGRTADQVTEILVDAGCLAPGSSAAIVQEMQVGRDEALKASLACLFDGGAVAGCGVPCTRSRPADAGR